MNPKNSHLRILEASIVLVGNLLAILTFLSYTFVSGEVTIIYIIPIYIAATLSTLYLSPENLATLYSLNLLMYLPAALSLTELNWTLYGGTDPLSPVVISLSAFQTGMTFSELLLIGLALTLGYILLPLLSRAREETRSLNTRGDGGNIDNIGAKKASLALTALSTSLAATTIIVVIMEGIKYVFQL